MSWQIWMSAEVRYKIIYVMYTNLSEMTLKWKFRNAGRKKNENV